MRLPPHLDRHLVDLYRGWDVLEKTHHSNEIIDFDLAPQREFPPMKDRGQVLEELQHLASSLESDTTSSAVLARARLKASETYLRALMGEEIEFRSYIQNTLCIEPRPFTEDRIDRQREIVKRELRDKFQLSFDRSVDYVFETRFYQKDLVALKSDYKIYISRWVPVVKEHVEIPINDYQIEVTFESVDAYWKNWISGNLSSHQILLRI